MLVQFCMPTLHVVSAPFLSGNHCLQSDADCNQAADECSLISSKPFSVQSASQHCMRRAGKAQIRCYQIDLSSHTTVVCGQIVRSFGLVTDAKAILFSSIPSSAFKFHALRSSAKIPWASLLLSLAIGSLLNVLVPSLLTVRLLEPLNHHDLDATPRATM